MQRMTFATALCALALALALAACVPSPTGTGGPVAARPERICGPRPEILTQLFLAFGERPFAAGTLHGAPVPLVAEFLVAEDGSWTMITTDEAGRSCLEVGGGMWSLALPPSSARKKGGL